MHIAIRGTILVLVLVLVLGAAGYLKQPVRKTSVDAVAGSTTVVFKDPAPGDYAFSVVHDANGNGRMDTNRMGRPTEAVAFSKDAQGFMGPPSFEAARFTVPAGGAAVSTSLR